MKKFAKKLIVMALGMQVRRLRAKNDFKTIIVGGSVGKTSTKFAVAQLLSQKLRVQYQKGNYNDIVTVPLVYFGLTEPSLLNVFAWLKILIKTEHQLHKNYPYDVVVLELGTDGPGQIEHFAKYLHADIAIMTAITYEHMEYFGTLDAVAKEELSLISLADKIIINTDTCDDKFLHKLSNVVTIGFSNADYSLKDVSFSNLSHSFTVIKNGHSLLKLSHPSIAKSQLYSLLSAVVVADIYSFNTKDIVDGLARVEAASGRMKLLKGLKNSTIIDDTYNASPLAVKGALDTLYSMDAPQKIAVLGNMNELGDMSKTAHIEVGHYCDPKKLFAVVTIGPDANKYLAESAEKRGCRVERFDNPYDAGEWVKANLKNSTLVLVKGSQNRVFAEEAIKTLLDDKTDVDKLVRQSDYWLRVKHEQFGA